MQGNRILKPANKQTGFSLVELMISIAIGLLITAAVTAMAVNSLKMNSQTLKSARLNQDAGAVMQIMVNDIRRTAYSYCDRVANNSPDDCPDDPQTEKEGSRVFYGHDGEDIEIGDVDNTTPPDDDCILYSYNQDTDSNKDDYFGFRRVEVDVVGVVNKVGVIQMADNTGTVACNADDNWVSMTDPEVIDVTLLEFNSDGSKCNNIDEDISIRIKPGVSARAFACKEVEAKRSNAQEWTVDGNGNGSWNTLPNTTTLPLYDSGDPTLNVGIRHVNISLEAELTRDPSVSKNLDVSIKVRNDHVYLN